MNALLWGDMGSEDFTYCSIQKKSVDPCAITLFVTCEYFNAWNSRITKYILVHYFKSTNVNNGFKTMHAHFKSRTYNRLIGLPM